MTPPESAWTALRDHTYLILDDGSLFCTAGNRHTRSEVLGCLYYTPASALGCWDLTPNQRRTLQRAKAPDGSPCCKIGPTIAREPARFARTLRARGVRWWPSTHLQAVARERIVRALDPVVELARTVRARHQHRCPMGILIQVVNQAAAGGVPSNQMGLTGSASFNDTNVCGARDIDLVLIHPVRFAAFVASVQHGWQPLARLDTADPRRRRYLAERLPHIAIDADETRTTVARRLDVGWCGDVRIDLTEVAEPCGTPEQWPFDMPSLGIAEMAGSVSSVERGYPFLISLAEHDHPIMITRRGWQGVLRVGDRVALRGDVFDDGGRFVVVDNRSHHQLRLLGPHDAPPMV